ncbi:peptide methionine sulfoxide reductase [Metschnikowia bicuspidata]|uniref:peptide-methionine (S)-S-oxide reductase n=1 Tax=Metschnikowia bicuspidata TaxID=27322 RepID=A0A4P9ZI59_9ASCO|nr:peptide methionine sulfoxide reductase [Metschnikowia bicuspidata]
MAATKVITVAAGCFWGVEKVFSRIFLGRGLLSSKVGYANGSPSFDHVDYRMVCSGNTDFSEAVQLTYDPAVLYVREILEIFFRIHDPTTVNSQGPDVGSQYRSGIYTQSETDLAIAQEVKEYFQKEWYPNKKIVTEIEPLDIWIDAEDYHQQYLEKNPGGYECPTHFLREKPRI